MYTPGLIYSSLIRIGLAFLLVFVWLPRWLFPQRKGEGPLDRLYANLVQMSFWSTLAVYLLAATRLYEVISLGAVYLVIYGIRLRNLYPGERLHAALAGLVRTGYDLLDRIVSLRLVVGRRLHRVVEGGSRALGEAFGRWLSALHSLAFLGVLAVSAYLRFADAVRHAAPALSDSYITLAWMKYIERRQLFHDGIYPQGFHIYLSILRKFSAVDPLLVLKYAGPFNGVLIVLSVYYLLSRLTGQKTPALVGAFAYGVLARDLPYGFIRQAATNSQEYALVFLLPTLWFGLRYLQGGDRRDACLTLQGLAVIGLSHAMVAFFAAAGILAVIGASVLSLSAPWRRLAHLIVGLLVAGLISAIPLGVGMVLGKSLHSSSAEFAAAKAVIPPPPWTGAILDGLILAALAGLYALVVVRHRSRRAGFLFVVLLLAGATALYQAPRLGVQSVVLAARSGELLALALCLAYGLFWHGEGRAGPLVAVLAVASMAGVLLYRPPQPAEPYKMQWDEAVEQYLRIAYTHLPTDWLIVSNEEGYALVLGRGWHLTVSDFLARYSPSERLFGFRGRSGEQERLLVSDIYIFYEKEPYPVPLDNPQVRETYRRRLEEGRRLRQWIEEYQATHNDMKLYYEGERLQVYTIHREKTKEELFRELWGEER